MESTNLGFRSFVTGLADEFVLTPAGVITRTTTVTASGWFRPVKYVALWFGLKAVHRFVFRNWAASRVA